MESVSRIRAFECLESFCHKSGPISESALPRRYEHNSNGGKKCAVEELEGLLVGEEIASNSPMFEVLGFWAIGVRKRGSRVWMFGIVLSESRPIFLIYLSKALRAQFETREK